jgi:hypothetical protein
VQPTYRPDSGRPKLIQPTYRPDSGRPRLIQPTYRPAQPVTPRTFRFKRQLSGSQTLFESGKHKVDGNVFANQQVPYTNVGAGLNYAHQQGHGASVSASNTFDHTRRLPGTTVDVGGQYNLHTSKKGNTLDAYGGVSKTYSHFGNSRPQYNAGLRYRFRRQAGEIGGSQTLFESGKHKVDGSVFGRQNMPEGAQPLVTNLGAGVNYAHQNGHGASLSASNTLLGNQRIPGTTVDLGGQYNLHTSKRGNSLDAYGGVSKTYSHFGNSRPQYNAGLRYRF